MAKDQINPSGSMNQRTREFEEMSDADLIAYIGGDIDPSTSRAELIDMAMQAEERRGQV